MLRLRRRQLRDVDKVERYRRRKYIDEDNYFCQEFVGKYYQETVVLYAQKGIVDCNRNYRGGVPNRTLCVNTIMMKLTCSTKQKPTANLFVANMSNAA